jgi:hypothetical protein
VNLGLTKEVKICIKFCLEFLEKSRSSCLDPYFFMKYNRKIVYVFLRNKIIGIDSILPLCMEISGKFGYKFIFISFEHETYKYIAKDNVVIKDMIDSIGRIDFVSLRKYKSRYLSILSVALYFIKAIINIAVTNGYVIHSAHLNIKPLMWIRWFFKKSNIIFVERKIFGGGGVNSKNFKKKSLTRIYESRLTNDEIREFGIDMYSHPPFLYAGILIAYNENWNYFKHPAANQLKKIIFKHNYRGKHFVDFVNKHAYTYIKNQIPHENFESGNILVFIATRITRHSDSNAIKEFSGALKALSKYLHIFPLFIKLHTFSDTDFIDELIKISLGSENSARCTITNLHPMILSSRAIISVFANEGTVMSQLSAVDVPIIDLQIHENVLESFHLKSCIEISESELASRYERRKLASDYTFNKTQDFDKFMEQTIAALPSLNIVRTITASSQKDVLDL